MLSLPRSWQLALLVLLVVCAPPPRPAPVYPDLAGTRGGVSYRADGAAVTAQSDRLELRWDQATGALIGLRSVVTGAEMLDGDVHASWSATVDGDTNDPFAARGDAPVPGQSHALERFTAVPIDGGYRFDLAFHEPPLRVTQHVTLVAGSEVATWTTDVTVDAGAHATAIAIASPELLGVAGRSGEHLVWPWHEGVIFPEPGTTWQAMVYPSPASMQWQELYTDRDGLYFGVLDPSGGYKELRFGYDPRMLRLDRPRQMGAAFFPFATGSWTSPPVEIGIAPEGAWYWAADRYRAFLARSGMARALPDVAADLRGWHKGYGRTKTSLFDYCQIPTLLMPPDYTEKTGLSFLAMYGWHHDGLDSFYPDYDFLDKGAADPTCLRGSDLGAAMGSLAARPVPNRAMFYVNGHIADVASQWMQDPANAASAAMDASGNRYRETYDDLLQKNRPFEVMCPSAPAWRARLEEKTGALRDLGASGIYWDQVEEMPSVLCFDRTHGHATPATAFPDGYAKLFAAVHERWSRPDRDYVFASEGVNDFYSQFIDVAGGMPARLFGFTSDACGGAGWPCGGAVHAPEVARYTMFAKFLGLATFGVERGAKDEFARAFLMGDPLKTMEVGADHTSPTDAYATTNPHAFPRYTKLYEAAPDVYFRGAYRDARGLSIDARRDEVMATLILGSGGDRAGIQLWNETDVDRTVRVTVDVGFKAIADLDGLPAPALAGSTFSVLVPAHDVKALLISL